jgi:hypothetical protein
MKDGRQALISWSRHLEGGQPLNADAVGDTVGEKN